MGLEQYGYTDANGQPVDAYGRPAPLVYSQDPKKIFTPEALAKQNMPTNPFQPGTKQYNDFQNEQVSGLTKMAGAPIMPDFVSQLDANGRVKEPYQLKGGNVDFSSILPGVSDQINGVNINQDATNEIRNRALSTGPSAWLGLQTEKQGQNELNQVEKAKQQVAGNQAQAEGNLAMRGGLSGGARERLAMGGATNGLQAEQAIRRAGASDRTNLGIADEGMKTDLLKTLPGIDLNAANFKEGQQQYLGNLAASERNTGLDTQKYNSDQNVSAQKYNITNALNDILQKRAYDSNKYNETMKSWAADKTAEAQGGSGKK